MLLNDALLTIQRQLSEAGIESARLDTLILFEDLLDKNRAWILAHPEYEISKSEIAEIKKLLVRRVQHEPLAYIRSRAEFYGREYIVSSAVLVPRPESESMIDLLKELPDLPPAPTIVDLGSGSGALGITAQLELPKTSVDLLEINGAAIKVSQMNVDKFTLDMQVHRSDLLATAPRNYDIVLANLPYVPDGYEINRAAQWEPPIALFAGQDGLNVYGKLFEQLQQLQSKPLYLILEAFPDQHTRLVELAASADYDLYGTKDFAQAYILGS